MTDRRFSCYRRSATEQTGDSEPLGLTDSDLNRVVHDLRYADHHRHGRVDECGYPLFLDLVDGPGLIGDCKLALYFPGQADGANVSFSELHNRPDSSGYDFSEGERGKLHQSNAVFRLSVYLAKKVEPKKSSSPANSGDLRRAD